MNGLTGLTDTTGLTSVPDMACLTSRTAVTRLTSLSDTTVLTILTKMSWLLSPAVITGLSDMTELIGPTGWTNLTRWRSLEWLPWLGWLACHTEMAVQGSLTEMSVTGLANATVIVVWHFAMCHIWILFFRKWKHQRIHRFKVVFLTQCYSAQHPRKIGFTYFLPECLISGELWDEYSCGKCNFLDRCHMEGEPGRLKCVYVGLRCTKCIK